MSKILVLAHRKRFINYFRYLFEGIGRAKIISLKDIFKSSLILHRPSKLLIYELLEYEEKKFFYKPDDNFLKLKKKWFWFKNYVKLVVYYSGSQNIIKGNEYQYLLIWGAGGFLQKIMVYVAHKNGLNVLFMENGFLPNTTALDSKGVNANSMLPRDSKFYIDLHMHDISKELPGNIVARESKKAPFSMEKHSHFSGQKYVFIPFQCNSDSVIIWHSPTIKNMWQFGEYIVKFARIYPDIDFVIKEHPSCPEDYSAIYKYIENSSVSNVVFRNSDSTEELIKQAEAIMTINSSVGFESLLFKKPVISLGNAAYNIDGLVLYGSTVEEVLNNLAKVINDSWMPDSELVDNFLRYVYHCYLVQGTRKIHNEKHRYAFQQRLLNLID